MVYTFNCKKCGKDFEKEMSFAEYDNFKAGNNKLCECGGEAQRTFIMTSLTTELKGDGWYQTEHGKGHIICR